MWTIINVKLNERVVVLNRGLPQQALGPGRHLVWGFHVTWERFNTEHLVFKAHKSIREVIPSAWFAEVTLGKRERGVVYRDGVPVEFLRPGTHRYWTLDESVHLFVMSVDEPLPELTDELVKILPRTECEVGFITEHQRGLKFVQGKLTEVLEPGRYAFWSHPEARVVVQVMDVRRQQVAIVGQELMTRDKVTLRLSLTIEYVIENPELVHGVSNLQDALYLIVQLSARQFVAASTLDELLEGRNAMQEALFEDAVPKAARMGVRVERVGVKDVVLPGEMKALLNRVIEAEKEAAANVILRREETAATRSLANTAKVMADHPVLLRLKELEALKDIAERINEVRVVVGADGFEKLLPAELGLKAKTS